MKNKEIEEMIQNRIEDIYQSGEYIYQAKELEEILSYIEQLGQKCESLLENKNETLRYISNYLALNQRYKLNDNVDEKLKLVKKILNGREKTITNISYEDLLKENKQLEKRNKELQQENQQLKKQKDDVVEYIKNETEELEKKIDDYAISKYVKRDLLRMLGEIDVED